MKDLIVCDFDNILVNKDESIPTSTIILFDELRRDNKKLVLITDKSINKVLYYNYSYPFIDYIISSSGSYVYDVVNEKNVFKRNLLYSDVKKIIKTFYGKYKIYLTNDKNYYLLNCNENSIDDDESLIDDYNDFMSVNKNNIYKIDIVLDSSANVKNVLKELNNLDLKIKVFKSKLDSIYVIGIIHENVNKLFSLRKIFCECNSNLDNVIYIGTDTDILKNVSVGVTTNDEYLYVKKVSKYITDDCNHKGVENFLKKYYEKVR